LPSDNTDLDQGVEGVVTQLEGDFSCCPVTGTKSPMQVPVHAIAGRVATHADEGVPMTLALSDVALVASTSSGEHGEYWLHLPPGTYTIGAEVQDQLYFPCHDVSHFCAVDVLPDEYISFPIDYYGDSIF
jgi:hypothetical protein